jgi:hypothetical protein
LLALDYYNLILKVFFNVLNFISLVLTEELYETYNINVIRFVKFFSKNKKDEIRNTKEGFQYKVIII